MLVAVPGMALSLLIYFHPGSSKKVHVKKGDRSVPGTA
jgi:hypothetical protein